PRRPGDRLPVQAVPAGGLVPRILRPVPATLRSAADRAAVEGHPQQQGHPAVAVGGTHWPPQLVAGDVRRRRRTAARLGAQAAAFARGRQRRDAAPGRPRTRHRRPLRRPVHPPGLPAAGRVRRALSADRQLGGGRARLRHGVARGCHADHERQRQLRAACDRGRSTRRIDRVSCALFQKGRHVRQILFRLIGILEVTGGGYGMIQMLYRLLPFRAHDGIVALIGLALYAFVLVAGVRLLENSERGVRWSGWAQLLQLPLIVGLAAHFGSQAFVLAVGGPAAAHLGINLLALLSWLVLKLR